MNRLLMSCLALPALALAGCAGSPGVVSVEAAPIVADSFVPATLATLPADPLPPAVVPVAVPEYPPPAPAEPLRWPLPETSDEPARPLTRVADANRDAEREPRRDAYANAVQIYDWAEGALYRLYTAPERVSDIALEPGESLVAVAAGDTARWVIGDTTSGTGPARRIHVLVKPTAPGLRTNLIVTTDRRVYHVSLESSAGPAMTGIAWTYPAADLLVVNAVPSEAVRTTPPPAGLDVDALSFAYVIEGDDPPWRPLRAFDDGRQVFIEFGDGLARGEAPPLFVSGSAGGLELVNYRVRGRFYIVDRLFAAAELRLGERRQQVVRIRALAASAVAGK